jgi:hypothetical protein
MKKNAPTAKRLASGSKDTKNPNAIAGHKKKDEAEAALQAIKERRERTDKGESLRGWCAC